MSINDLIKDRGFRYVVAEFDGIITYVFTIRKGSFDCFNNWTYTKEKNQIHVKIQEGTVIDIDFVNFNDPFAMEDEAITKNCERKLKKLIHREMF